MPYMTPEERLVTVTSQPQQLFLDIITTPVCPVRPLLLTFSSISPDILSLWMDWDSEKTARHYNNFLSLQSDYKVEFLRASSNKIKITEVLQCESEDSVMYAPLFNQLKISHNLVEDVDYSNGYLFGNAVWNVCDKPISVIEVHDTLCSMIRVMVYSNNMLASRRIDPHYLLLLLAVEFATVDQTKTDLEYYEYTLSYILSIGEHQGFIFPDNVDDWDLKSWCLFNSYVSDVNQAWSNTEDLDVVFSLKNQ